MVDNRTYGPECAEVLNPDNKAPPPASGANRPECACNADGALCARSCDAEKLVICKAGGYSLRVVPGSTSYVVRGGSYMHSRCALRLFVRRKEDRPAGREIGFRCASSDPPPAEQRI